jgi:hypothetical protein
VLKTITDTKAVILFANISLLNIYFLTKFVRQNLVVPKIHFEGTVVRHFSGTWIDQTQERNHTVIFSFLSLILHREQLANAVD